MPDATPIQFPTPDEHDTYRWNNGAIVFPSYVAGKWRAKWSDGSHLMDDNDQPRYFASKEEAAQALHDGGWGPKVDSTPIPFDPVQRIADLAREGYDAGPSADCHDVLGKILQLVPLASERMAAMRNWAGAERDLSETVQQVTNGMFDQFRDLNEIVGRKPTDAKPLVAFVQQVATRAKEMERAMSRDSLALREAASAIGCVFTEVPDNVATLLKERHALATLLGGDDVVAMVTRLVEAAQFALSRVNIHAAREELHVPQAGGRPPAPDRHGRQVGVTEVPDESRDCQEADGTGEAGGGVIGWEHDVKYLGWWLTRGTLVDLWQHPNGRVVTRRQPWDGPAPDWRRKAKW